MAKRHGRITLLTEEKHRELIGAIRAGVEPGVAALAARLRPGTVRLWLHKGKKIALRDDPPETEQEHRLLKFYEDYKAAEAELERLLVASMTNRIRELNDPDQIMRFLARRFAERWMHRSQVGMSQDATDSSKPVEVEFKLRMPKQPVPPKDFQEPEEK